MDLWFEYIRGYLSGFMAPENSPIRAIGIRQENILHRPREVVEALQGLGLRRNGAAFHTIETLRTGYTGLTRNDILLREQVDAHRVESIQELIVS